MNESLTEDNFLLYAAKYYSSVHYCIEEFNSDLNTIFNIRRLIRKYLKHNKISEQLIINHLILLYNVFENSTIVNKMLFYKLEPECYPVLKTFLLFLNRMPEFLYINKELVIVSSFIQVDLELASTLRKL